MAHKLKGTEEEYPGMGFLDRPTIGTCSPAKTREFFTGVNTDSLKGSLSNIRLEISLDMQLLQGSKSKPLMVTGGEEPITPSATTIYYSKARLKSRKEKNISFSLGLPGSYDCELPP